MKTKIVILGSTGSIGENTFKIIKKNKKKFEIILLSTNTNIRKVFTQAKVFNVKNVLVNDYKKFIIAKSKYKNSKIKIFNTYSCIDEILKNKFVDYSMVAISGLDGLAPTLKLTKYSKNLAIANKESLICGWSLIQKKLKKFKTNFIPIDSEHFSIFTLIKNYNTCDIEKVYITASGGPFLNLPKSKFSRIKLKDALKHPNWKMGKKITIDSATLMNKVFEVIEAKNIFNIDYNKISILTHPKSYVHAIIKFKNGLSKIVAHDPDMKIPIYNSIYLNSKKNFKINSLNLKILNNLNLKKVDYKKFPLVKLLNKLPTHSSLFETILITINDYLVFKFLKREINFEKLMSLIGKISNLREFQKYKKIKPKNVREIYNLRDYVSLKLDTLGI
jgi:1-deoxy-D-xylulose-5-phosphate reductoisomerase